MKLVRGLFRHTLALGAVLGLSAGGAGAADYPSKPVTLVVPYKAGGSTETMAQVFSKALGSELGTKVIVKTRPGAGGAVGSAFVAQSDPDGYTILFAPTVVLTWDPIAKTGLTYTTDSFTYIAGVSEYQMAFISTPDKQFKTFKELIAYSKQNPGVNVADQGSISKAFINYIAKKEGIDWTPIPTRGGGEMVPFLLGGKVDFAYSGGIHQKYGDKMTVLASALPDRLPAAPGVPSLNELYGISMPGNAIIVGPKGMPAEVVAKLDGAVKRAMNDEDFGNILARLKFPKKYLSSADLTAHTMKSAKQLKEVYESTK